MVRGGWDERTIGLTPYCSTDCALWATPGYLVWHFVRRPRTIARLEYQDHHGARWEDTRLKIALFLIPSPSSYSNHHTLGCHIIQFLDGNIMHAQILHAILIARDNCGVWVCQKADECLVEPSYKTLAE